jgi:hypothetical protein
MDRAIMRRPDGPPPTVDVLFIGGSQRSGSTLLDRLMSQIHGYVSAGELVHLWARGVRDNELCGCGEAFHACPFWGEVGRLAFGGWDRLRPDDIIALQRRVDRNRYIFFMIVPRASARYRRDLAHYTEILGRLYRAISTAGEGIIVDSSKHASTAFLLRRVVGLRLSVVHLVRDSRGVAFSLGKRVRRPEVVEEEAFMHRQPAWRAAVEWVAFNGLFHLLRLVGNPVTRIRYEDLLRDPRSVLASLASRSDATRAASLPVIDGSRVTLGVDHTVAGNPMRFARGELELRLDDGWRRAMRPLDRRLTTALTAPLLKAYGYRLASSPVRSHADPSATGPMN